MSRAGHTLHLNRSVRLTAPGAVRAVLAAFALRLAGQEVIVCNSAGQPYLCLTVPTRKER